ncbi:uncharacterized protein LOC128731630 [Anopheles nili]|uniref:uncharacterized protein LOC128731630 n=1 Tax=Anopheles nili TaxID=185578 RepID=UPI00237C4960|nr:uncharacterized protein LOC128731630 [Anopheles nili]
MINLSTSTAAHAYACRTGRSVAVVDGNGTSGRGSRRHHSGTANGLVITDGLDLLEPGYASFNGFSNNRFQYQIPTVGQHYGNAFHLADDDEERAEIIVDHQSNFAAVADTLEEQIIEEDEEDDTEMSTAVEVISIDPNCDYDTDEENEEDEEEEEEEEVFLNDEEIEELVDEVSQDQLYDIGREVFLNGSRKDSSPTVALKYDVTKCEQEVIKQNGGVANCTIIALSNEPGTADRSNSENNGSDAPCQAGSASSMEEETEDDDDHHSYDDGPIVDFSPTKSLLWEPPAQLLQGQCSPKKPYSHGRRKRRSNTQRQSFSMPHSPINVGAAIGDVGALNGSIPTSLSFDGLDSLVCDLSPLKGLSVEKAANELLGDDLLEDELANAAHFDLTAYITGDDSATTDGTSNGNVHCSGPIRNLPQHQHPKSRGKELKMLRQLMLPREQQSPRARAISREENSELGASDQQSIGKRSCTAKSTRLLTVDDDSSEVEDEDIAGKQIQTNERRLEALRKGTKRRVMDDTEKDPTWNPNPTSCSKPKLDLKVLSQKQSSMIETAIHTLYGRETPKATREHTSIEESSKTTVEPVVNGVKFGQMIKKDLLGTSSAGSALPKVASSTHEPRKMCTVESMARNHPVPRTNVHRKKTNVKLDHDYCSPKRGSLVQVGPAGAPGAVGILAGQQRKTIEIPFQLPMQEQLRHERKLQKEKNRAKPMATRKPQEEIGAAGSCAVETDNSKDKQPQPGSPGCSSSEGVSVTTVTPRVATNPPSLRSDAKHPLSSSCGGKRTDVDKTFVNKVCKASDSGGANEIGKCAEGAKKVGKPTLSNEPPTGSVKRQVSLLKINQPSHAVVDHTKPVDASRSGHVSHNCQVRNGDVKNSSSCATVEESSQECAKVQAVPKHITGSTPLGEAANEQQPVVVVRKKLNLQEYKKRREHPESAFESSSKSCIKRVQQQQVQQSEIKERSADNSVNAASENSSKTVAPLLNAQALDQRSEPKATPVDAIASQTKELIKVEPLDPISAAKMKALRMQQLKKEAAIKSNEAKLSQTFPLMPIVPLAEITSLEFDEHGNPLQLDEAGRKVGASTCERDSLKLHPDYEEIIIVSIGCNTALTIEPSVPEPTTLSDSLSLSPTGTGSGAPYTHQQQLPGRQQQSGTEKEVSLLMDISDTIKRCCPSVNTMPGNSLFASIQEVVSKKSSIANTSGGPCADTGTSGSSQTTVSVGVEATVAESAVTLKANVVPSLGVAAHGDERHDHQYMVHQNSPYVGVSPPSSFSPGKPERAHTSNSGVPIHGRSKCTRPTGHGTSKQGHAAGTHTTPNPSSSFVGLVTLPMTCEGGATVTAAEHGEDKVIMHLRKDRIRTPCTSVAMQTEPSARFPPLCKLAPLKPATVPLQQGGNEDKGTAMVDDRQQRGRKRESRHSERRHYRRYRRGGSASQSEPDSDAAVRLSSRSKSRQLRYTAWDRHSRSRSRSRSRRRSSRRRSSCSSRSRSRSRSGYSRVHRGDHHYHHQQQLQQQTATGCSGASSRYSRSRRKSRTCSRSSSSSSSSRSRGRRSLSSTSSSSSMSSSTSSDGEYSHRRRSRSGRVISRSRSPRSRSRSGLRSGTPDQRYHSRERPNHRRTISPERKIVYVGRLEHTTRKEDLEEKFQPYGKIVKITLHLKANGSRYGFVTFEKPQAAYDAIDARGTDPNLRSYDISFGGRRAFCRTQYADLDGELTTDHDHQMPYVSMDMDGSLLLPARAPMPYSVPSMCHKDQMLGATSGPGSSFEDLLKQFKKGICALKSRKT